MGKKRVTNGLPFPYCNKVIGWADLIYNSMEVGRWYTYKQIALQVGLKPQQRCSRYKVLSTYLQTLIKQSKIIRAIMPIEGKKITLDNRNYAYKKLA